MQKNLFIPVLGCGVIDFEIVADHLISTIQAINSSLDCQEECQGNLDCKSWSYNTDLAVKTCELFRPDVADHTKRDTFDVRPDCLESDMTIAGNDIVSEVIRPKTHYPGKVCIAEGQSLQSFDTTPHLKLKTL